MSNANSTMGPPLRRVNDTFAGSMVAIEKKDPRNLHT